MKRGQTRVALATLLFAGLVLFSTGCSTVPITGRSQLNLISAGQEMQLGLTSFEKMKGELPINRDPAINDLVQRVGQRIAAVASRVDLPNAQWEFVVFESKQANAFCLPGGKVGVYTGLLPITQDEAGLATVIGHEVAHAAAHHGAERMSEALVMQTGSEVVGATLSNTDPRTQTLVNTAYGLGSQLFRTLPHSRRQEAEADHIGLMYMARAGYNPEAAVSFWERFAKHKGEGGQTMWFLRTHPVDADRVRDLKAALPKAKAEFASGAISQKGPQAPAGARP